MTKPPLPAATLTRSIAMTVLPARRALTAARASWLVSASRIATRAGRRRRRRMPAVLVSTLLAVCLVRAMLRGVARLPGSVRRFTRGGNRPQVLGVDSRRDCDTQLKRRKRLWRLDFAVRAGAPRA